MVTILAVYSFIDQMLRRQRKESLCLRISQHLDTIGKNVTCIFGNHLGGAALEL